MSRRRKLRAALAHKALANDMLDNVYAAQLKYNELVAKINQETAATLDADYVATIGSFDVLDTSKEYGEAYIIDFEHLFSKKLGRSASAIQTAIVELETNLNLLLAKLDAEAGTLNDVDYVSTLGVEVLDIDVILTPGASRPILKKEVISKFANKALAEGWLAAIVDMQTSFNELLAILDAGTITPAFAAVAAQFDGQVAGMTTDVTIDADVAGAAGNITLVADSVTDIDGLILAWNTGNPANEVTLSAGDGSQVPTANIVLAGGADAIEAVSATSVSEFDPDLA